jgi:hypothetical protein
MIQNGANPSQFTVQTGEQVTVTLEAFGCACNTGGAFDNQPATRTSSDPDVYTFQVDVNGKTGDVHFFTYVCHFFQADLPNSRYDISASGNRGGGTFPVRSVAKQTATPAEGQLTFTIA